MTVVRSLFLATCHEPPPQPLAAFILHRRELPSPFAPYAVTTIRGRDPSTVSFPPTLRVVGVNVLGLKSVVFNVPVIVAFPAALRFPPSVSPNAEILFPDPDDEASADKITSEYVIVPVICGPLIRSRCRPAGA